MKDLSIMVDDVKFNYRAALLIEKNGKILLEFNPSIDFVTIPGGRVKTLESSFNALVREMHEEMGINIKKEEVKLKSLIENFFEINCQKTHELYFLYKLKVKTDDKRFYDNMPNRDSNGCYYKFVSKKKLDEVNLLPYALRKAVLNNKFEAIVNDDLK